jgi:hypothetical protein
MNEQEQSVREIESLMEWLSEFPKPEIFLTFILSIPSECITLGLQPAAMVHLKAALLSFYLVLTGQEAGPAKQMLESSESALAALQHRDIVVRGTALWQLRDLWLSAEQMQPILFRVLEKEPNWAVRCQAIALLILDYLGSKNRKVCQFLAKLVLDRQRSFSERMRAYKALLLVAGRPTSGLSFPVLLNEDEASSEELFDLDLLTEYLGNDE